MAVFLNRWPMETFERRAAAYLEEHTPREMAQELAARDELAEMARLSLDFAAESLPPVTLGEAWAGVSDWLRSKPWFEPVLMTAGAFVIACVIAGAPVVFGSLWAALRAALWQ